MQNNNSVQDQSGNSYNHVLPLVVLVGCEESQVVTIELRKLGHEAYSCDLKPCSGNNPEWHFQMDLFQVIKGGSLITESGQKIFITKWDVGIFHPTCTFLCNSGVRWLYEKDGRQNTQRWFSLIDAMDFFNKIKYECLKNGILKFALENPIPHKYAVNGIADKKGIEKYTQLIQPWQFGDTTSKATCLWLYGLPELKHTNLIPKENRTFEIHKATPGPQRAELRSKTFPGIAKAMALQWAGKVLVTEEVVQ
jgi:hypothetical protein